MLLKKITLAVLLMSFASMVICSCKDDDDETIPTIPAPTVYENYSQLKVGNYWIYQRYEVDSLGNGTPTSVYDSCYVEKDTLVNNKIYFKVYRPQPAWPQMDFVALRDSLHYTVNTNGEIVFSSLDFVSVFDDYYSTNGIDTIYRYTARMADKNLLFFAPMGSFTTSNYKRNYQMYGSLAVNGVNRSMNTRYAKDVGMVSETLLFYTSQTTYIERRLVRYHLN